MIAPVELPEEVVRLSRLLRSQDATSCGSVRPSRFTMRRQGRNGSVGKCGKLRLGCSGEALKLNLLPQGNGVKGRRDCGIRNADCGIIRGDAEMGCGEPWKAAVCA